MSGIDNTPTPVLWAEVERLLRQLLEIQYVLRSRHDHAETEANVLRDGAPELTPRKGIWK